MTNSVMLSAFVIEMTVITCSCCKHEYVITVLSMYSNNWVCTVFYALSVFEVEFNWFCISFVQFYWFLIYSLKVNGNVILCETYFMPSMAFECGCVTSTSIGGM